MKKLYILLVVSVLFLITCKKIPELKIYNLEISEESVTTTTCDATITAKYSFPTEIYDIKVLVNASEDMNNATIVDAAIANNVLNATISNLVPSTNYYYCFRYSNGINLVDTDTKMFKTQDANLPLVTTKEIVDITLNTATSGGNVTSDGGVAVTARGTCWNTEHNPTISNSHTTDGDGTGEFISSLTGLTPNTTYYVKAYAVNTVGVAYGDEISFTTIAEPTAPTVNTIQVTNITPTSARIEGNVTSSGGADVTERGVCWGTNQNPTISGNHSSSGSGTGSFVVDITGLTENTTYYARAYAKNSVGTAYGDAISFTTSSAPTVPTVTTNNITNITQNSATGGGKVVATGGANVSQRGICWSTSQNPTTSNSHASSGIGIGNFTCNMTNLSSNTTYYVRAYAVNEVGTAYGEQKSFTTGSNVSSPTVTTNNVTNITTTSATCGGNVTSAGNGTVSARGVCWSTSQNPTISNSHTTNGTGTGTFTSSLTGLTPNTVYYIRAYATNEAGTAYGSQKTFTTLSNVTIPTVTTNNVSNITTSTATCGGNVTSDGGANVTARGVCWSTASNPTISNSHTTNGSGTGAFTSSLTGLTPNTTYYVRAYATNGSGTAYGSQKTFTTNSEQPQAPTGAINGLFSVSATQQVWFSQGNLQYRASTNTWRFAENQWDYVGSTIVSYGEPGGTVTGSSNNQISSTYNGWIDLFGWGTSGYNHGAVCYEPWGISIYDWDYYAYGSYSYNLYDQTGKADWGYNSISNGGNTTNTWRTLTIDEWIYLLYNRSTASGIQYVKAIVNGINGLIILPDNWNNSIYSLNNINTENAHFNSNIISLSTWANTFESNGAIFLPTAGTRDGNDCYNIGEYGNYWSASHGPESENDHAYQFYFENNGIGCGVWSISNRGSGNSVRLVHNY